VTEAPKSADTRPLTTKEMARFLRRLSVIFTDESAGVTRVSDALNDLARILSSLPDQSVAALKDFSRSKRKPPRKRWAEAEKLSAAAVKKLLLDQNLLKSDVIELAHVRFNMPRARLEKMPLERVLETVWSAADNEESLRIIADNADRAGKSRGS